MMLGHALAAFAAVAAVAGRRVDPQRAVVLGAVAGLFAAVPDVDILFALPGLAAAVFRLAATSGGAEVGDVFFLTESFWTASSDVHRSVTHSLVVAVPSSIAAGLVAAPTRDRPMTALGGTLLALSAVAAAFVSGPVAAAMMVVFGAGIVVTATVVRRRTDLSGLTVAGLAAVGLFSHPFGDLFTGGPPRLLYPLAVDPVPTRVLFSTDRTLHMLGTFALEVVAVWAAVAVVLVVYDREVRSFVRPVALVGVAYGLAALVLAPPTLSVSYHFVFSVLGLGLAACAVAWTRPSDVGRSSTTNPRPDGGRDGSWPRVRSAVDPTLDRERAATALVTGVTTVSLAWLAYLVVYAAGFAPT